MPQRRPKFGKRREGQLERLPEKLQRKRERRVSARIRRMPNWIKFTLVLTVLIVISVGVYVSIPRSTVPSAGPTSGHVYIVQMDQFYCNVNNSVTPAELFVDYMETRFGVGTYNGTQPLHVTVRDTFNEDRNLTLSQPFVWDYFGNCYKLTPEITARSIRFNIGGIQPALVNQTPLIPVAGSTGDFGPAYWSLFFGYSVNSANDSLLAKDHLTDLFALNFSISSHPLTYGNWSLVNCTMTLLPPTGGIQYSDGLAYIQFPTKVYNGTDLLANITLKTVRQVGTPANEGTYTSNQSLITMRAPFTFLSNNTWGFAFVLNVTSYASGPFCLLNLSKPECRFFLRAGVRASPPVFDDPPTHFPKASITVNTPYKTLRVTNYTEVFLRLPEVWLNATHLNNSTPVFVPLILQPSRSVRPPMSYSWRENPPETSSLQTVQLSNPSSRLTTWATVPTVSERFRRPALI